MALIDETTTAADEVFQDRVRAAVIRQAIAVITDAQEEDAKRLALARYTLLQPEQVVPRVASVAAANGATTAITDVNLLSAIETNWTTLSKLLIN